MRKQFPRGMVILEALLAVGISAMYMTALVTMVLVANAASDRAEETQRALWNVHEGLEALQTIAFADLPITDNGLLAYSSNHFTVAAAGGPQILDDGMARTVKVRTVRRDAGCLVVVTGGTVDDDSRYVESTVSWTDTAGREHDVTARSLRTRWDDPQGTCFAATMAAQIDFNISGAVFSGGKQLRDVYFTNTGNGDAVIDTITMTWDNAAEFDQMFMENSKVWSSTGPGTPRGSQTSGVELDIEDFVLSSGMVVELNKGQFNINMGGTTMTMIVTFTDGSSWTSPEFMPN